MKNTPLKRKSALKAKKPMAKKAKSKSKGWYNNKLDGLAKKFAKERDNYTCQKCGEDVEGSNAHGSHVIPVSAGNALRWDLNNIKCLSYHNHINWWHKNPTESGEWFKAEFPERWDYLQARRHSTEKIPFIVEQEFYDLAKKCKSWQEYQELYSKLIDPIITGQS